MTPEKNQSSNNESLSEFARKINRKCQVFKIFHILSSNNKALDI
jgi:hypothetical protein